MSYLLHINKPIYNALSHYDAHQILLRGIYVKKTTNGYVIAYSNHDTILHGQIYYLTRGDVNKYYHMLINIIHNMSHSQHYKQYLRDISNRKIDDDLTNVQIEEDKLNNTLSNTSKSPCIIS